MVQTILNALGKGWKTLTGVILYVLGNLSATGVLSLPLGYVKVGTTTLAGILQMVGVVLAALGIYHRVASADTPKS